MATETQETSVAEFRREVVTALSGAFGAGEHYARQEFTRHEEDALAAFDNAVAKARADALAEAQDAASDAIHDAIEEMGECERVKSATLAAIAELPTEVTP